MQEQAIVQMASGMPVVAAEPQSKAKDQRYIWKLGTSFFPSKKESILVDTYLQTRSYPACIEKIKAETGRQISIMTAKRWMQKEHVQAYLQEQTRERGLFAGWTKEHFFAVLSDHIKANADYEQAVADERMYTNALDRNKNDPSAQIGLANARAARLEASKNRLAGGDLAGLKLVMQAKGWADDNNFVFNQSINFTEKQS